MTKIVSRLAGFLLFCGAFIVETVGAHAQELKIGFLAPRTGIITQLGTDMVNGFQMYLDEVKGDAALNQGSPVRIGVDNPNPAPGRLNHDVRLTRIADGRARGWLCVPCTPSGPPR